MAAPVVRRLVVAVVAVGAAWSLSASGVVSRIAELVASFGATPGPADVVVRRSADELVCPEGTEMRHAEAESGEPARLWCEIREGDEGVRHGPFLELHADGSTARQGTYERGLQVGEWVRFTPAGEVVTVTTLAMGESSRHLPAPEDLCPPGTTRHRSFGFDHRRRMWSSCLLANANGKRVLGGPEVTWDEEPRPFGARYVLRDITTYRDDERHGRHAVFEGPFGREAVVEEETYDNGRLEGASRGFYVDGTLREERNYLHGELHGDRIGYSPDGSERWRVTYRDGRQVAAKGDLMLAGVACPEGTVPTFAADGTTAFCARRNEHFLVREGPYVVWDATGGVVESGLYANDEKKELWIAPESTKLPPAVGDDLLVAQIELMVGDQPYLPKVEVSKADASGDDKKPFDVWFRDNTSQEYPHPRTELRGGVVEVYGLPPGSYYMEVQFDANPANELQWPGDLIAALDFEVAEREVTKKSVRLLYTLHLLSPRDNDRPIPGWRYPCEDEKAIVTGPVRFAWERPAVHAGMAVEYHYWLTRRQCDNVEKIAVVEERTPDTELTLELPPSRPGEVYDFTVVAEVDGKVVGQLMSFGEGGGYGWSLRFRHR